MPEVRLARVYLMTLHKAPTITVSGCGSLPQRALRYLPVIQLLVAGRVGLRCARDDLAASFPAHLRGPRRVETGVEPANLPSWSRLHFQLCFSPKCTLWYVRTLPALPRIPCPLAMREHTPKKNGPTGYITPVLSYNKTRDFTCILGPGCRAGVEPACADPQSAA